jgi:hypothetical protein
MNTGWLVVAMGAAAVIIGGYIVFLVIRFTHLQSKLDTLRKEEVHD